MELSTKLFTKDLSCGSSRCVSFGAKLLTSCEFERLAERSFSKNWKASIRFRGEPLLNFLEYFQTINARKKIMALLICQCLLWSLGLRRLYHLWKLSLMLRVPHVEAESVASPA